jgi:hypothetical protein
LSAKSCAKKNKKELKKNIQIVSLSLSCRVFFTTIVQNSFKNFPLFLSIFRLSLFDGADKKRRNARTRSLSRGVASCLDRHFHDCRAKNESGQGDVKKFLLFSCLLVGWKNNDKKNQILSTISTRKIDRQGTHTHKAIRP